MNTTTRRFEDPGGETRSYRLDTRTVELLRAEALARLEGRLGRPALADAMGAARELAEELAARSGWLPPAAARLEAFYLIGPGDPADLGVAGPAVEPWRRLEASHGPAALEDLAALCQLEEWPGFFAAAPEADLGAYLGARVLVNAADRDWLIAETLLEGEA